MKIVIDTDKIKEFIFGKKAGERINHELPPSQYGEFPPLPDNLDLKGLRNGFDIYGERMIQLWLKDSLMNVSSKVLDIGCGSGRIAMPMTKFLESDGSYIGLDIHEKRVNWLNKNISSKYSNFKFIYSDVFNRMYNPKGKFKANEYKLPFEDESFDFVCLLSVFTHMLPEDVNNYLREIYRVLKKGGKCVATYFIINRDTLELLDVGRGKGFRIDKGEYMVREKWMEESMIAYKEDYIRDIYNQVGFKENFSTLYGNWRRSSSRKGTQDAVVAEK